MLFFYKHILLQHTHLQQEKENKAFDMNLLQEPTKLREGEAEKDLCYATTFNHICTLPDAFLFLCLSPTLKIIILIGTPFMSVAKMVLKSFTKEPSGTRMRAKNSEKELPSMAELMSWEEQ